MPKPTKTALRQRDIDDVEWNKAKKIKAEALIKEEVAQIEKLKKEKLKGSLISITHVEESFLEIGSKTKSSLYRLVAELPPRLEGLPASDMIAIIRTSIDEVCLNLSNNFLVDVDVSDIEPEPLDEDES